MDGSNLIDFDTAYTYCSLYLRLGQATLSRRPNLDDALLFVSSCQTSLRQLMHFRCSLLPHARLLRRRLVRKSIILRVLRQIVLRRPGATRIRCVLLFYPLQAISSWIVLAADICGSTRIRRIRIKASLSVEFLADTFGRSTVCGECVG